MSRVLLLDADREHATGIAWALRNISCQTITCSNLPVAVSLLQMQTFEVVVVVSVSGPRWNDAVDTIRHAINDMAEMPQIVCLLRGPYHGPNERIHAARKGYKVIYEP